jgi:Helix-hairpin-helix domain
MASISSAEFITHNQQIADKLRQAAELLAATGADPFRVKAYRRASKVIRELDRDLSEVARGGISALQDLPEVGRSIAAAIMQMLLTGRWPYLEHLRGAVDPVDLLQRIPGGGPTLARRIHETLGVSTLEQLEVAALQGGLDDIPGIGPRRMMMLRAAVADMLSRIRPRGTGLDAEPGADLILDVDGEYRRKADELPTIAPRRFNPAGKAWLPILHTRRGQWAFTALYSNTARAHELEKTKDWVVIFFHREQGPEAQRTVVTETHGPLVGKRVVRGRERECEQLYEPNRHPGRAEKRNPDD